MSVGMFTFPLSVTLDGADPLSGNKGDKGIVFYFLAPNLKFLPSGTGILPVFFIQWLPSRSP